MFGYFINWFRVPHFVKPKHKEAFGLPQLRDKYPHYYVDVSHLEYIDVYRVLRLFKIKDPEIAHAVKKLLACGLRGFKDSHKDVLEAIDTLKRWIEINGEDANESKSR